MVVKYYMAQCAAIMEHEYGINDEEVLMAIKYHTTGRQQMTKLKN